MPASSTYSADAPTVGQSHTSAHEPSMEDILASIRRIIAEDQSNNLGRSGLTGLARRAAQPAPAPLQDNTEPAPPQAESVSPVETVVDVSAITLPTAADVDLDHRPSVETHDEPPQAEVELRGSHDAVEPDHEDGAAGHAEAVSTETPHRAVDEPQAEAEHVAELDTADRGFDLSDSDRLPSLAEQEPLISSAAGASITSSFQTLADTVLMQDPGLIERIMRETLRPMLKTWLDDHLPSLVERLVRAEIERVARGGRSRD